MAIDPMVPAVTKPSTAMALIVPYEQLIFFYEEAMRLIVPYEQLIFFYEEEFYITSWAIIF